ncbi:MAG: DUF5057 domain-containing protein [Syntrophomonadaceae bacterium]|nr:DUF5057 domain-containing protein [Syntrophomonadaceae bacterium]
MMKMVMGMRMHKSKQAGARAISCAVILALCLSLMPAAWAPDWMPGPEPTAAAAETPLLADRILNVLEITPDVNQNSLGYYVPGKEPVFNWAGLSAGMQNKTTLDTRKNSLIQGFDGLMGTDDTSAPLKLTSYTEKYPWDVNEEGRQGYINAGRQLVFANAVPPVEVRGYVVARPGTGVFSYDAPYALVSAAGGENTSDRYNLNIDHFEYTQATAEAINAQYGVTTWYYMPSFEKIPKSGTVVEDGWDGYKVLGQMRRQIPNETSYYYKSGSQYSQDPTDIYEYKGKRGDANASFGAKAGISITYKHTGTGAGPTASRSGSTLYGAVVTSATPYTSAANGPFYKRQGATGALTFEGAGDWDLVRDDSKSPVKIYTNQIYYDLSYTNNNWFKTKILGNAAEATMNIKAPGSVNTADVSAAELICLSAGFLPGGTATAHSKANDITADAAKAIYRQVTVQKRPIIVDYDIVKDLFKADGTLDAAKINGELSNLQKLALMCLVDEPSPLSIRNFDNLSYSFLNGKLATLTADADKSFVKDNVFCFGSLMTQYTNLPAIADLATGKLTENIYSNAIQEGFANLKNKEGNSVVIKTMADIIRYIIEFEAPALVPQGQGRVLVLQPAAVSDHDAIINKVKGWLPAVTASDIQIMTTSEFVGRIEDLRETYDLIYIDDDISGMNTNAAGTATVYNDNAMNGRIYSHFGDLYRSDVSMAGLLDVRTNRDYYKPGQAGDATLNKFLAFFGGGYESTFWQDLLRGGEKKVINDTTDSQANLFRFSGNDINESACDALVAYSAADYPIVLGDNLVSGGEINKTTVDENSWLYKALDEIWGAHMGGSAVSESNASTGSLAWYWNRSKVKIEFVEDGKYPPPYVMGAEGLVRQDGAYYLEYEFTISNNDYPEGSYDCRLYVDVNADGRFLEAEEADNERLKMEITSGGSKVDWTKVNADDEFGYYELTAGPVYRIKSKLASSMVGVIPWKLVVDSNDNRHDVASATGFTRAKPAKEIKLNILQIMEDGTSNALLNLEQQLAGTTQTYKFTADDILYETKGAGDSEWHEFRDVNGKVNWAEKAVDMPDPNNFMATLQDANKYPIVCFLRSVPDRENEADFYKSTAPSAGLANGYRRDGTEAVENYSTVFHSLDDFKGRLAPDLNGAPILYIYAPPDKLNELAALTDNAVAFDNWRLLDTKYDIYKFEDMGDGKKLYYCKDIQIKYDRYVSELKADVGEPQDLFRQQYKTTTHNLLTNIPFNTKAFVQTLFRGTVQNYRSWGSYDSGEYEYYYLGDESDDAPGEPVDSAAPYPHKEITYPGTYGFIYQDLFNHPQIKEDYTVNITTVETTFLKTMYGNAEGIYGYLDTFNMLILGFGDTYEGVDEESAEAIQWYINNLNSDGTEREGYKRAVLFSHDTTSPINVAKGAYVVRYGNPGLASSLSYATLNRPTLLGIGDSVGLTYWGYWFNTKIRDAVGLDRYAVSGEADNSKPHDSDAKGNKKEEIQGFTNYALIHNNTDNIAGRAPRTNPVVGYTNNVYRNADASSKVLHWSSGETDLNFFKYSPYRLYQNYNETHSISQVNKGQITTYPYDLNTSVFGGGEYGASPYLTVGNTHEQYYQLNTAADDAIVWYCLAHDPNNPHYENGASYYKDVPNDVRNAYYIYTKDNITYTGMGHDAARQNYEGKKDNGGNYTIDGKYVTEAKLFVNTILAAYRPELAEPEIMLLDPAPSNLDNNPPEELEELEDKNLYFTRYGEKYEGGDPVDPALVGKEKFLQDPTEGVLGTTTPNDAAAFFFQITDGVKRTEYAVTFTCRQREGTVLQETGAPLEPQLYNNKTGAPVDITTKPNGDKYYKLQSNVLNDAATSYSVYKVFLPDDLVNWLRDKETRSLEITINVTAGETGGQPAVINIRQNELQSLY